MIWRFASVLALCVLVSFGIWNSRKAFAENGIASIYSLKYCGKPVAWKGILDCKALTGAHKTLPFGTIVKVLNIKNGKMVILVINDRGPFVSGRIVDLTPLAAQQLGCDGLCSVHLERLTPYGFVP